MLNINNPHYVSSLTVDVEEYFHAANLEVCFGPERWHTLPSRVERSTLKLLEIFDEHQARGTFFVLGYVARRHQELVREIARRGHEIASHGYGHRIVWTQTPKSFYRDVRKAKLLLEDITSEPVLGYRAPNFSIVDRSLWAYDELKRAGYSYDSSLYPVPHPRYGNAHRSLKRETRHTTFGELEVLPLSVFELDLLGFKSRLGVAGGGWWRLLPKALVARGIRQASSRGMLNCYLHPWEIDPEQPHCAKLSMISSFRHYTGLAGFHEILSAYLKEFGSSPLREGL
jgi:polysaccharide deacetylase family protein (PEP-CTERM system associated)